MLNNSDDTLLINLYANLLDKKGQLNIYVENNSLIIGSLDKTINKFLVEINRIENILIEKLSFSDDKIRSVDEIQNLLNSDDVVVEIVRFREYNNIYSSDSSFTYSGLTDTISYAYLLIPGDIHEDIQFIYRKNQNKLEGEYYTYYINSIRQQTDDTLSYQYYWQDIDESLRNFNNYYFSNDGIGN